MLPDSRLCLTSARIRFLGSCGKCDSVCCTRSNRVASSDEALEAADQLKAEGTAVRVIDLYCVKPIDGKALAKEIGATGGRLITVEDHWAEGGIGEAVLSALAQASVTPAKSQLIAVREMPHSGKPNELVDAFGISARHIVEAVRAIL